MDIFVFPHAALTFESIKCPFRKFSILVGIRVIMNSIGINSWLVIDVKIPFFDLISIFIKKSYRFMDIFVFPHAALTFESIQYPFRKFSILVGIRVIMNSIGVNSWLVIDVKIPFFCYIALRIKKSYCFMNIFEFPHAALTFESIKCPFRKFSILVGIRVIMNSIGINSWLVIDVKIPFFDLISIFIKKSYRFMDIFVFPHAALTFESIQYPFRKFSILVGIRVIMNSIGINSWLVIDVKIPFFDLISIFIKKSYYFMNIFISPYTAFSRQTINFITNEISRLFVIKIFATMDSVFVCCWVLIYIKQ